MGLVDAADGEGTERLPVHAAAGRLVLVIEGASMLVDHDPVVL